MSSRPPSSHESPSPSGKEDLLEMMRVFMEEQRRATEEQRRVFTEEQRRATEEQRRMFMEEQRRTAEEQRRTAEALNAWVEELARRVEGGGKDREAFHVKD